MFIKKLIASAIVMFAIAVGMASVGTTPMTTKSATAFTPYTQTALLVQSIAAHHTAQQAAAAK